MTELGFFSIDDIAKKVDLKGQYIFYRAGFDCLDEETGEIKDPTRVNVLVPSIKKLSDAGAKVVIYSHNGRPNGEIVNTLKMDPIGEELNKEGIHTKKLDDCVGAEVTKKVKAMKNGDVILMENIRFHQLSTSKKQADIETLAKELTLEEGLFNIYVNGAWPVSHRESADMTGAVRLIKYACADPQVILEYKKAINIITKPRRPYAVIIGGKKADKTKYVKEILGRADILIPTGAFANSVEYNRVINIQGSLFDKSQETQDMIDEMFESHSKKIIRPIDVIATDNIKEPTKFDTYDIDSVPKGFAIVGVGPKSIGHYKGVLGNVGAVAWAGPLDVYENPDFRAGTEQIGYFLANDTKADVMICGGDTGDAANELGFAKKLLAAASDKRKIHISTGGGVNLPLLVGEELPGIKVLKENYNEQTT